MGELVKVSDLFEVKYGINLELNKLEICESSNIDSIRFVSRKRDNNGVSAFVRIVPEIKPNPANTISVAGGGSYVLSSFLQSEPYYSGRDVYILTPKSLMSDAKLIYYCQCIYNNRYKYNFGRQANKTLKDLLIPLKFPTEFENVNIQSLSTFNKESVNNYQLKLNTSSWNSFELEDLFAITASRDNLIEDYILGGKTPYIASTEFNNGVIGYVHEQPTNKAGTITANRGGSVGYFFYQPTDYLVTPVDVRILTPKFSINEYIGLFLITVLKLEKYRFNYSRKMGTDRLKNLKIKLPSQNSKPDFEFMENYIKSLPYSANLEKN